MIIVVETSNCLDPPELLVDRFQSVIIMRCDNSKKEKTQPIISVESIILIGP